MFGLEVPFSSFETADAWAGLFKPVNADITKTRIPVIFGIRVCGLF
jgi:hypothetical protein